MKLKSAAGSAIRGLLVLAITATAFIGLSASPAEAVTVEGGCGPNRCYRQWRAANGQIVDYAAIRRDPATGRIRTRSCDYNRDGTTLGVQYDPSDGGSRTIVHAAPGTLSNPAPTTPWATTGCESSGSSRPCRSTRSRTSG
jgi:hypothetical protein